jgi:hypothetical protein
MELLEERLAEIFEYSHKISSNYIRSCVSHNVIQWHAKLWGMQKQRQSRPEGLSVKNWQTLERIRMNPEREHLTQTRKYANVCQLNLGRTGPKGELGIKEDLRRDLCREPDPNEVTREMRRDKGYGRLIKKNGSTPPIQSLDLETGDSVLHLSDNFNSDEDGTLLPGTRKLYGKGGYGKNAGTVDMAYVKALERQVRALKSLNMSKATNGSSTSANDSGPSAEITHVS